MTDDELIEAMHEALMDSMAAVLAVVHRDGERLRKGLNAVRELINESTGVYGLHLNGDVSPWDELRTGGRFEEWLMDFDAAVDAAMRAKG